MPDCDLPARILIGPRAYTVGNDDPEFHAHNLHASQRCLGIVHHYEGTIAVDTTICAQVQREVLLHEIIHGICDIPQTTGMLMVDDPTVQGIAVGILEALRRNPDLVRFLLEETSDVN